jgi:hypothetical protein
LLTITEHLREALGGEVDSPIASSVTVQRLEHGSSRDRILAQLVDGVDDIRRRLDEDKGASGSRAAREDLAEATNQLLMWREIRAAGDPDLDEIIRALATPVGYFVRDSDLRSLMRQHDAEARRLRVKDRDRELRAEREAERHAELRAERHAERHAELRAERDAELGAERERE